jgi:hypothetical protein
MFGMIAKLINDGTFRSRGWGVTADKDSWLSFPYTLSLCLWLSRFGFRWRSASVLGWGRQSGGVALLNHRLQAGTPGRGAILSGVGSGGGASLTAG